MRPVSSTVSGVAGAACGVAAGVCGFAIGVLRPTSGTRDLLFAWLIVFSAIVLLFIIAGAIARRSMNETFFAAAAAMMLPVGGVVAFVPSLDIRTFYAFLALWIALMSGFSGLSRGRSNKRIDQTAMR